MKRMMTLRVGLGMGLVFGMISVAWGQDPLVDATAWQVRVSRMAGAAESLETSAKALEQRGAQLAKSGRLSGMSVLIGYVDELDRQVAAARLAAEVLDKPR